jgi:uncharacterized RDD family membrane protein YckC
MPSATILLSKGRFMNNSDIEYAGFWVRVGATLIDTLLILTVTLPILISIYGWKYFDSKGFVAGPADFLISWVLPAAAAIWFWTHKQASPGKMALSIRVLDAESGATLTTGQSVGRYLAYFVSVIPFGLGLFWVGFDKRKQGWHDKLAHSVVVRAKNRGTDPVRFPQA